ncbi:protein NLRC3-like [Eucyclogobius newberryi]|uniref:protein NLRC3-like n=1 Tax=Eucyclogobius newberryi TaxID=166745 RepID=UPI003B595859
MRLEKDVLVFVQQQLQRFHRVLASDYPECSEEGEESREVLNITLDFLKRMDQEDFAQRLKSSCTVGVYRDKLKSDLQQRFSRVFEGVAKAGDSAPLTQIYTELYITEGGASEVNQDHEIRHLESTSRRAAASEKNITCEDIFKARPHSPEPIRAVLTKGVAGVGKTVLTQKFSLDWAEGRAHQELTLLFPFSFRELNVFRDTQFSLVELLHHFFSPSKALCSFDQLQVLFILDGLDECRLSLDFSRTRVLSDPTESVSVDVLLVNLIRGCLLPSARLWITTRPAAANQIPAECISMVTEVRGFADPQKEEYFRKRFRDVATAVISHIKSTRSLHIMCHIPVFCWILSTVIQKLLEQTERPELPRTLTQMYVHFLVVQAKVQNIKYHQGLGADLHWTPETRKMVQSLGKLAFEQLQKGNLIFYEGDLSECGLDAASVSVYSGVFTQVFREEPGLYQDKVYCFIHLSVQEFLAALHVHQTFFSSGQNLFKPHSSESPDPEAAFYSSAVDQALQSPNGHLDLFLRFLLGLSLPTNQRPLQGLLTHTRSDSQTNQETVKYIHQKLEEEGVSSERSVNMFHCLNELEDQSLVERMIQEGHLTSSNAFWAAVSYCLLSSDLEVFDLKKIDASEWVLLKLLSVVESSTKALLSDCNLSERSCEALSSILSSEASSLKVLDLSRNPVQDCGVEQLCAGLKSATCRLETLSLSCCNLTERSCGLLSSVLSSSSLTHLDLSDNRLLDSGVDLLCAGLKSPLCSLETLSLSGCLVSEEGVAALVHALASSRLKELDLTNNSLLGCKYLPALQTLVHRLRVESVTIASDVTSLPKYFCELFLDPLTAHRMVRVEADNRRAQYVLHRFFSFGDFNRTERFKWCAQVLCSSPLVGRCYWEVEWSGEVDIAVCYRGIPREGDDQISGFGMDHQSWCLRISKLSFSILHRGTTTIISSWWDYFFTGDRVAVYLDCSAGTLSFYDVLSGGELKLLYTFNETFSQPLYAAFGFRWTPQGSSVSLVPEKELSRSSFGHPEILQKSSLGHPEVLLRSSIGSPEALQRSSKDPPEVLQRASLGPPEVLQKSSLGHQEILQRSSIGTPKILQRSSKDPP